MIEFKNVSKTYDNGTNALRDVSIKIEDGEFVFIVGSSGAGKSTFLKIIMREQVANSGSVIINNYDLNKIKKRDIPKFRRTMGIVFQVGLQVALNIGVVSDFLPNTGISLPFFSAGGTSLVILLGEMGMVLSVSRASNLRK